MKFRSLKSLIRWARPKFVQNAPKSGIRTLSITMVKNEQDIIETFLRTNRPYLDAMIVMDNGSIDATRSIAIKCAQELGGIFVVDSPKDTYDQAAQINAALLYSQSAFFADHVFLLDCDEFLWGGSPAEWFASLSHEKPETATRHAWRTFLPDPQGALGSDPLDAIRFVRREERPIYYKCALHLMGSFRRGMNVSKGAHAVKLDGKKVPAFDRPDQPLVHIPVRSADQIAAKAVKGWGHAIAEVPDLSVVDENYTGRSYHLKRLLDQLRRTGLDIPSSDLADLAMSFAQKELPATFMENAVEERPPLDLTRRHSDGRAIAAERSIAQTIIGRPAPDYRNLLLRPARDESGDCAASDTVFSDDWHWSHVFFDIAPFRFLVERFQPQSVLDIGCGKGIYLRLFESLGTTEIFGTDGVDQKTTVLGEAQYRPHDLHKPLDLGRSFDLVMCLEVIEHLDPSVTAVAFDSVARHAKDRIVFSVASPGQNGRGHINCLDMNRVLDLWAERGWTPDLVDTLGLRAISSMSWFRRNLLVLRRSSSSDVADHSAALRSIAALEYRWYGQEQGIRPTPFSAPYPRDDRAYGRLRPRKN